MPVPIVLGILDGITVFPQERISAHEEEQIAQVAQDAKECREEITNVPLEIQEVIKDILQERISERTRAQQVAVMFRSASRTAP